ncbi:MAG: alpha/beta fold hydrolase [Alphaproteobacteria bacterium]|nr:alpha/beta fold hydrolase [Alphaproteobacteria bacterium]
MSQKPVNILQTYSEPVRALFFFAYVFFVYLLIFYTIQDDLIFHPEQTYISPKQLGTDLFIEQPLTMTDGTRVMTWYAPRKTGKPALLFFHGNAGQIARFAPQLISFVHQGYPVMMVEYRGFAQTPGHLRQDTAFSDAAAAFDFLKEKGHSKIVAMGYSFGSAVAVGLADRRPIDGLILMAPFESLEQFIAETPIPFARYILKDSYPSSELIRDVYVPILMIHGKRDLLIPSDHAERLYGLAGSAHRQLKLTDDDHSSVFFSGKNLPLILKWLGQ